METLRVRIHAFEPASRANGPGLRSVLWFQGCSLGCAGCFNPETHHVDGGQELTTREVSTMILAATPPAEGVSFTGGEPFQQPAAFLDILTALKSFSLSTLCFSGYRREEIEGLELGREILARLDVLVAGRFVAARRSTRGLLGSANQEVHWLTDRYRDDDLAWIPERELILHRDGSVTASGIDPVEVTRFLR